MKSTEPPGHPYAKPSCERRSASWVRTLILLLQLLERQMSVNLRCLQAFVAQQLLNSLKVGSVIEHCGRKRVSQHVWASAALAGDV